MWIDYIYYVIGGYFILAGILGTGMYLLWLTFSFRLKFYDLETLYGRTGARVFCIIFGILVVILKYLTGMIFEF